MIQLKKKIIGTFNHLQKFDSDKIKRKRTYNCLENFLELLYELTEDKIIEIINHEFVEDILSKYSKDIDVMLDYFQDLESRRLNIIRNCIIKVVSNLNIYIFLQTYPSNNLVEIYNSLLFSLKDPQLSITKINNEEIFLKTTIYHVFKMIYENKFPKECSLLKIEMMNDYFFKLLHEKEMDLLYDKYIPITLKQLSISKLLERLYHIGIGYHAGTFIYHSIEQRSLIDVYSMYYFIDQYIAKNPKIKDMDKRSFYLHFDLHKNLVKKIDKFLEIFKYAKPYTYFRAHILTLEHRQSIKYLQFITFPNNITKFDINIHDKIISVYTIKKNFKYFSLQSLVKNEILKDNNHDIWYHGTSRSTADNILEFGISDITYNYLNNGFGIKRFFPLDKQFKNAVKWAQKMNEPILNDYPAILIYKTPKIEEMRNKRKEGCTRKWNIWDLSNNDDEWKHYVQISKNKDKCQLEKHFPRSDQQDLTDIIYGPIPTDAENIDHDCKMQLVLKSEDAFEIFSKDFIKAVFIFEGKILPQ